MARKDIPDALVVEEARAHKASGFKGPNLIERLMARTGECEKVCYAAASRTDQRGLIEYGVSIRYSWPTDYKKPAGHG